MAMWPKFKQLLPPKFIAVNYTNSLKKFIYAIGAYEKAVNAQTGSNIETRAAIKNRLRLKRTLYH